MYHSVSGLGSAVARTDSSDMSVDVVLIMISENSCWALTIAKFCRLNTCTMLLSKQH
jgi:hypothetical protein